jgi:hypothetical protein
LRCCAQELSGRSSRENFRWFSAAVIKKVNDGGGCAIYGLLFLWGRERSMISLARAWTWKQSNWDRHAMQKWPPLQFPREPCFAWFAV